VWLVVGEKPGDNAQIVNLARAVGWDFEEKKVFVKPEWVEAKPRVRPSLDHVDLGRSDSLEPPWPDLVITAGRRLSSVGLWIKQASQGRTRLVLIGKPRRMLDAFDLIVVAAHYVLPEGPNVARHDLPLMHADARRLEQAAAQWREHFAGCARPLTALFVGGPTGGLCFDLERARDLFQRTLAGVRACGGSLYVSTSRRTPPAVAEMLERECPDDVALYLFDAEAGAGENPYHALLALADHFVVTTDSVSMMVEVARLGRSLSLYPLDSEIGRFERVLEAGGIVKPLSARHDPIPAGGLRARMMYRLGRPQHARDLSAIPRRLVEKGLAVWLGDPPHEGRPYADDELERIARRIRALVPTGTRESAVLGDPAPDSGRASRLGGTAGSSKSV